MASRKDSKGRVLQTGEYQRPDGRYQFSYYDIVGTRRYIYAKTLYDLRELEKEYRMATWMGATQFGNNCTLNQMFDRYLSTRVSLKESSRSGYLQMYDNHVRNEFGEQPLRKITYSDVLSFYAYLSRHEKLGLRSIQYIHSLLHSTFEMATLDGIIVKNPAKSAYGNFKKQSGSKSRKIHAISEEEQNIFLEFMNGHPVWGRYYPIFQMMLGTGLRAGELCALRWEDIDMENRSISVNHGLVHVKKVKGGAKDHYIMSLPKSDASVRDIPIMDQVMEAIKMEYIYSSARGFPCVTLDGYTDFVFTNKNGNIYTSNRLDKALSDIVAAYNKQEIGLAEVEERKPILLPHISNHMLRHTFCTRLCERDINIKVIQTIMGHASIKVTMDIYAEVSQKKQAKELEALAKNINVF